MRASGWLLAGSWMTTSLVRTATGGGASIVAGEGPYGDLLATPDPNGILLPAGFQSRVVAEFDQPVGVSGYKWHVFPDGGACFFYPDGYVYVSNSEWIFGGVGALRFDHDANIVDAYPIMAENIGGGLNCAGGATLWNTWLTCEEVPNGQVWECDPLGVAPAVVRPAMGRFTHEAVAQDPNDPTRFYLTEDIGTGGFYRFTVDTPGDLSSGVLEIAQVVDDGSGGPGGDVVWHVVPDPDRDVDPTPTSQQVPDSTPFDGGEGIIVSRGIVFFTTKGDHRVWAYDPATLKLCVHYDRFLDPAQQLTNVDNITATRSGDLYVAEDGGNLELVILSPEGTASPMLRLTGQDGSEIAGPAFDPSQSRLYFSSQRGGAQPGGITYEITGPFRHLVSCL